MACTQTRDETPPRSDCGPRTRRQAQASTGRRHVAAQPAPARDATGRHTDGARCPRRGGRDPSGTWVTRRPRGPPGAVGSDSRAPPREIPSPARSNVRTSRPADQAGDRRRVPSGGAPATIRPPPDRRCPMRRSSRRGIAYADSAGVDSLSSYDPAYPVARHPTLHETGSGAAGVRRAAHRPVRCHQHLEDRQRTVHDCPPPSKLSRRSTSLAFTMNAPVSSGRLSCLRRRRGCQDGSVVGGWAAGAMAGLTAPPIPRRAGRTPWSPGRGSG